MKWTKEPRIAMLRLADALGLDVASTGKKWMILNQPCSEGLTYTVVALLCYMARVTMSSPAIGGSGLSPKELRWLIRFHPDHDYSTKYACWSLKIDGKIAGTDEATMYKAFFNPDREAA